VEVVGVDQRHVDRRIPQALDDVEAAEARPDHDDARPHRSSSPPAMATATSAATRQLFSARASLAGTLYPRVASPMRPSTNGVTAAPVMLLASASARAATRTWSRAAVSRASSSGMGTVRRTPVWWRARLASTAATAPAESTRCATGRPEDRV